jgi:hypothetical protein
MKNRRSFRPELGDALEARVVLSQGSTVTSLAAGAIHALHASPPPPGIGQVGAVGDSYTDEYKFYPPDRSTARNWVEILHATRGVRFGTFTNQSRGEPRTQGFADNWARSGATTTDMVNNQIPGLTSQTATGQVNYAWMFIGGNDFQYFLLAVAAGKIAPANVQTALAAVTLNAETNFDTGYHALLNANPDTRLVVSNLPDISVMPAVKAGVAGNPLGQVLIASVSQAIAAYDAHISSTVASHLDRTALIDLATVVSQLEASPTSTIQFGGQTIFLTTANNNYHSFFLADGIHIGTVGQGIIADLFVNAVDSKFGARIAPLSQSQIVAFAQKVSAPGGSAIP